MTDLLFHPLIYIMIGYVTLNRQFIKHYRRR